jgi:hypothetical protein
MGHMDKAPVCLISTCGTSNPGKPALRLRSYMDAQGMIQRRKYIMQQPQVFEMYRSEFNSVDQADKAALGPHSLCDVWQTKKALHRLFAASLAFCESNGYHAMKSTNPKCVKMTRDEWRKSLAYALTCAGSLTGRQRLDMDVQSHTIMVPIHGQKRCTVCVGSGPNGTWGKQTKFACQCGTAVCSPTTGRPCWSVHVECIRRESMVGSPLRMVKRHRF